MALETTTRDPVQLTDPLYEHPEATPGCDVCAALVMQWKAATDTQRPEYDLSQASDRV